MQGGGGTMNKFFRKQLEKLKSGRGKSLTYNNKHGKFRVKYCDGVKSKPMFYDIAKRFAGIFNGKVFYIEDEDEYQRYAL
jgi:hypothetical protein